MIVEIAQLYSKPEDSVDGRNSATDTTAKDLIAAPGKGQRLYVTTIIVSNTDAAVDSEVKILDGSTIKLTVPAPKLGGSVITLPKALRLSENSKLAFQATIGATTLTVSAVGYKG